MDSNVITRSDCTVINIPDSFAELATLRDLHIWSEALYRVARGEAVAHTLLVVPPHPPGAPGEPLVLGDMRTDCLSAYQSAPDLMADPVVRHCLTRCVPLIWHTASLPAQDSALPQPRLAACIEANGAISLPMHGPHGERGGVSFFVKSSPNPAPGKETGPDIGRLTLIRDLIAERLGDLLAPNQGAATPALTPKELECLKWTAAGKSTWEISMILKCSQSAVNFHITNFRQKLDCPTRRDAVVKAIRYGIIQLD